jgi:addiction module HigA family antidote
MSSAPDLPELPGQYVRMQALEPKGMSVTQAARLLGVGRPALSNFLNGNAALSPDMASRVERTLGIPAQTLLDMQAAYDAAAAKAKGSPAGATAYVPPFLAIKANEIESWAASNISARTRLSVFLRTLVNSTGVGLTKVDFPGNEDAERPGWDGFVVASEGTPWIPQGNSGWEFGCNSEPKEKAESDYARRTKTTEKSARAESTFVFVTPRSWTGKNKWESDRRGENQWKDVRVLDASNLEQWLEQSIAAQTWFASETRRAGSSGTRSLDQCWTDWANVSKPPLVGGLFATALREGGSILSAMISKSREGPIIVAADSTGEALAFLAQLFSEAGGELAAYRDRVVVFDEPGVLPNLAAGLSKFIAVASTREVERELAPFGQSISSIVVYPRNAANATPHVVLEPLDFDAFRLGLETMGFARDAIERLSRESGRSLTVLRRRLSAFPAIQRPEWAADTASASSLVPFLFAGAWDSANQNDQIALSLLASGVAYPTLEKELQALTQLNDAPVWSVASHRGVVSKIDLLFAIRGTVTVPEIKTYFEVARLVLSEDDPSLDLPEKDRWAAGLYGKKRELSMALREGISETLVLLAVHGNALFRATLGIDVEALAARLVEELLTPLTLRTLEAQERDLPTYAEAAPDTFLKIFERDLKTKQPVSIALMRPADSGVFGRCVRTGLLWALENMAWSPVTLPQAVLALAELAKIKIEDNWSNKPIESLKAVFRSWMPQTAANLTERLSAMMLLLEHHPNVAWEICVDQFGDRHQVGHYSHKPRWRNDGHGFGEPLSDHAAVVGFQIKMVEMALKWKNHDRRTLGDLIARLHCLLEEHRAIVWNLVCEWASGPASDEDKAWLREKIRVSVMSRRATARNAEQETDNNLATCAKAAYEALAPQDILNRYEWLFRDSYVEESADELHEDVAGFEKREERIATLRTDALQSILQQRGIDGILDLAEMGKTPHTIGWLMVSRVLASNKVKAFVLATRMPGASVNSWARKNLVFGALGALSDDAGTNLLRGISPSLSSGEFSALLELAPFRRSTWLLVDELDESSQRSYWSAVRPNWLRPVDEDLNEAVERLLKAKRPRAAFNCVHIALKELRPSLLFRLMTEIASGGEEERGQYQLEPYYIDKAFTLLDKSGEFSTEQMAGLEFPYTDALAGKWGANEPRGIPHLERYLETHPELFVQAVAWVYKRNDGGEDPQDMRLNDPELVQNRAHRGYVLLGALRRIPGRNKLDEVELDRLLGWIIAVRQACADLGREKVGDHSIGKVLSHAPEGKDGVWPCEPVRDALERIGSEDISGGVTIGVFNARGGHYRGKGGDQERELATKYRKWARALQYSHPFVVSSILNRMVSTYENEGQFHDSQDEIHQRIRH